jgi:hypothetical protein
MSRKDPQQRLIGLGHPNLILITLHELAEEQGFRFTSRPDQLHGFNEWNKIGCRIESENLGADFELQQMPGCCAVLTLSYLNVGPYTKENFDYIVKIIEDATFNAGFGSLVMTQVVPAFTKSTWKNEPWILCLDRGWVASDPFRNAKSGNLVVYLTQDMKQKGKRAGMEVPIYG